MNTGTKKIVIVVGSAGGLKLTMDLTRSLSPFYIVDCKEL